MGFQVCSALSDCGSIDKHQTLNRCFLNMKEPSLYDEKSCSKHFFDDTLTDYSYNFYLKRPKVGRIRGLESPCVFCSLWSFEGVFGVNLRGSMFHLCCFLSYY